MLLNKSAVRQLVAEKGKRTSKEFVDQVDRLVYAMVIKACDKAVSKTVVREDLS